MVPCLQFRYRRVRRREIISATIFADPATIETQSEIERARSRSFNEYVIHEAENPTDRRLCGASHLGPGDKLPRILREPNVDRGFRRPAKPDSQSRSDFSDDCDWHL